jgi:hypothetical protein
VRDVERGLYRLPLGVERGAFAPGGAHHHAHHQPNLAQPKIVGHLLLRSRSGDNIQVERGGRDVLDGLPAQPRATCTARREAHHFGRT